MLRYAIPAVPTSVGVFNAPVQSILRQLAVASTVRTCEAAVKELASKNVESADVGSVEEQAPPEEADQELCAVQFAAVPKVKLSVQVPVPVAVMEFIPATKVTGEPDITEVPDATVPEAPEAIYISKVPCVPSSTKFIV